MRYKDDIDKAGGLAARDKKGPLWFFLPENDGSFLAPYADYVSRLYFPLMNEHGMKCSITPELKGDIASAFQHYLTAATVTEELHRNISGRNFWVRKAGEKPWSATGNSTFQKAEKWDSRAEQSEVEGHIGSFISRRKNEKLGLECEATVFVPATDDFVELMKVRVKNISGDPITFTPFSATPIFGRHADNFRDHRQVTTMFQKVHVEEHGVRVKPTIVHDEHGHSVNKVQYAVLAYGANGEIPDGIWPAMRDFIGEGGSMDNPEAVYRNAIPPAYPEGSADGLEAIGAMRFKETTLEPGEETAFIVLHGITEDESDLTEWKKKFGSLEKFDRHYQKTLEYWQQVTSAVTFETGDADFDNWARWISFQLKCRQIFGNSYLPDFGYGRGGRGWRDLWQDLLSIFLIDPENAREEIINNFRGIRIDGSNATIIGTRPGEFIADRNNVSRTWCDHGAWPVFVLDFYMNQTGDYGILAEKLPYWKDQHIFRNSQVDEAWDPGQGNLQKDDKGTAYEGSIFEHLLVQQLSAFYNVGDHNNILLEGGDWNDTLDMARQKGESVCFHNFFAHNFEVLARMISAWKETGVDEVVLYREVMPLLDRLPGEEKVDYDNPVEKRDRLKKYFEQVGHTVTGKTVRVKTDELIVDLTAKAEHMKNHIREKEWIGTKEGYRFFNGHYSNLGERIHGDHPLGTRMDLTSQVMPVMCDVATDDQVAVLWDAVQGILKDPGSDGLHLCTDFKELDLNIGRVTGFVYGNKEHGSKWMQQNIMLAYGLYKRGFVREGFDVLQQVSRLAMDSSTSLIFPGVPSYFTNEGRGSYAYLTGSSSWLLLTLLTQVFGIRGDQGDLIIEPQLVKNQFKASGDAAVGFYFAGRKFRVAYHNTGLLDSGEYVIADMIVDGKAIEYVKEKPAGARISRNELKLFPDGKTVNIEVVLSPGQV